MMGPVAAPEVVFSVFLCKPAFRKVNPRQELAAALRPYSKGHGSRPLFSKAGDIDVAPSGKQKALPGLINRSLELNSDAAVRAGFRSYF